MTKRKRKPSRVDIVLDCETTGLLQPIVSPLEMQPYITELFAYRLEDMEVVDEFNHLISVPHPLPDIIVKITGITDADLRGKPMFPEIFPELKKLFKGSNRFIAHNAAFDMGCVNYQHERMGPEQPFPWPDDIYCTVERSMHIRGRRMKLSELYKHFTGEEMKEAHRAQIDVDSLLTCYRALEEKK